MAEPGDPNAPETPDTEVDHDDGVGFASAASLQGRPRVPTKAEPVAPVEADPEPALDPEAARQPTSPVVEQAQSPTPPPSQGLPEEPAPVPDWARETPPAAPPASSASGYGRREAPVEVEGSSGLFAVYALILFAVPTLGVSAVIALLAVTGRSAPKGDVAASHFIFQQRTLWAGAVVALVGAILMAVGLGVFVLFLLALWLILRGAGGVLNLRAGRPIPNPRVWLL